MVLNAATVGAISTKRVTGIRAARSPAPKRAALAASSRTGRRPRPRITYMSTSSTTSRMPCITMSERISAHTSLSRRCEAGVTASTA